MRKLKEVSNCCKIIYLIILIIASNLILCDEMEKKGREIYIIAQKYRFIPDVIELYRGENIQLNILAEDVEHGFCCKELGIYLELPAGEEVIYEFTPDKVGEFEFYCCVYCGIGHKNMKGKFIVKESDKNK